MASPNSIAARMATRMKTLSLDSFHLFRSFSNELVPILRRQRTMGDAFRNTLVAQARQSNQVAHSMLSLQQQVGLIRYHGLLGYWRQRQGLLQAATSTASSNSGGGGSTNNNDTTDNNGKVAQVAFMITSNMRKEMTEQLGYTAEQIKSLTPVEASLILHHKVKPEDKEAKLPGLVQAHEEEQARIQEEQQRLEEQQRAAAETAEREKEEALAAAKANENEEEEKAATLMATQSNEQSSSVTENHNNNENNNNNNENNKKLFLPPVSQQAKPNEGIYRLDDPSNVTTAAAAANINKPYALDAPASIANVAAFSTSSTADQDDKKQQATAPSGEESIIEKAGAAQSTRIGEIPSEGEAPLGTFVATMEEQADVKKQWYEVLEKRQGDDESVAVGLFSNMEEAEMAMELKRKFADRRAKEDSKNPENIPATTYEIRETIK